MTGLPLARLLHSTTATEIAAELRDDAAVPADSAAAIGLAALRERVRAREAGRPLVAPAQVLGASAGGATSCMRGMRPVVPRRVGRRMHPSLPIYSPCSLKQKKQILNHIIFMFLSIYMALYECCTGMKYKEAKPKLSKVLEDLGKLRDDEVQLAVKHVSQRLVNQCCC